MFEAKTSPFRTRGGVFDRLKITSSLLLHMLVYGGTTIGPKQRSCTRGCSVSIRSCPRKHPPSDQIEQFKTFFCGVVMAGRLDVHLDVDS
jgi:hypothetical protein